MLARLLLDCSISSINISPSFFLFFFLATPPVPFSRFLLVYFPSSGCFCRTLVHATSIAVHIHRRTMVKRPKFIISSRIERSSKRRRRAETRNSGRNRSAAVLLHWSFSTIYDRVPAMFRPFGCRRRDTLAYSFLFSFFFCFPISSSFFIILDSCILLISSFNEIWYQTTTTSDRSLLFHEGLFVFCYFCQKKYLMAWWFFRSVFLVGFHRCSTAFRRSSCWFSPFPIPIISHNNSNSSELKE